MPSQKAKAIRRLQQRGYHPKPLRRIYIPKSSGKMRPLGIPCILCRSMQALYLLALDPVAETLGDLNSYGFRKERSTADAIEQCFAALSRKNSAQWILEGDIQACFDRISHEWLLQHIPMDKTMLRKWRKRGVYRQKRSSCNRRGYSTGRNLLARTRQYDPGWTREKVAGEIPKAPSKIQQRESQLHPFCRRLYH